MKNKKWRVIVGSALVLFVAALAIGNLVQAAPEFRPLQALLGTSFSYQGHLEDGGTPANGTYDLRFSLWDDSSVGSQVGSDVVKLGELVEDGLFTVELDFGDLFDGTALWLEVEVNGPGDPDYTALSPRQALTAVPYAHYALNIPDHDHWGEFWTGTGDGLTMTSSDGSGVVGHSSADREGGILGITDFDGMWIVFPPPAGVVGRVSDPDTNAVAIYGTAPNYAIIGDSTGDYGYGVWGTSQNGTGVYGSSFGNDGVQGRTHYENGHGVVGYATSTTGYNAGVYGETDSSEGFGGMFRNNGDSYDLFGAALKTINMSGAGPAIRSEIWTETSPNNWDIEEIFRVENDGDVYADGTFNPGGADFAEMLPAVEGVEAGDVLVIDLDGQLVRSTQAYQPTVVGVYSTQPGFLGGASDGEDLTGKVPLAVLGVVPVKVSAENGAIQPGDLLVASDTPGYAMRAGENPSVGTILGKALEPLESGLGVIRILVMLQ